MRLLGAAQLRVILRVVGHERAVIGERVIRFRQREREHDDNDRLVGVNDGAVVDILRGQNLEIAVFVRDLVALFMVVEIVFWLREAHHVDQTREAFRLRLEEVQTVDHLAGGEVVVPKKDRVERVRIVGHIGDDHAAVLPKAAELHPEPVGEIVVGIDDRKLQRLSVGVAVNSLVERHFPAAYPFGVDHVERHLLHACRHVVYIAV